MEIASPAGGKIPLDPQSLPVTELGDAIGIRGDKARMPLGSHLVEDGTLLTRHNHMSTKALAEALPNQLARPM
jgi:hypothetical protein